jgi:hypothetical protein
LQLQNLQTEVSTETHGTVQWEALAYLGGGFAFFGLVGLGAKYNNKASKKPYVSCSCNPLSS